jgi:hypothetical protein
MLVASATVVLLPMPGASADGALTQVSVDPFANPTSQHATELEPDTFAWGSTVVGAFQVGRFFGGGASDIGIARSGDGGQTWSSPTFLPGMTTASGTASSPYQAVSDASVAYDAKDGVWLVSSIPITLDGAVPTVLVNRSTDGGLTWSTPVSLPQPAAKAVDLDKNWTVCDNHTSSAYYGHCYTELDNFAEGDTELMSTSTDGGLTWSTPVRTGGHDKGLGGQPVVRPDGTVVVPFESLNGKIEAFTSGNGGATWGSGAEVSGIRFHGVAGDLRTSPLPSAEIDAAGRVYVVWEDCRFRAKCSSNDIVLSTSTNAVKWSKPARIPIDPVTSGADHFIPGLAVDPATSGVTAHLALTYYFYPDATCTGGCQLEAGYVSSPDGGAHWAPPTVLTGRMALSDIASTSQGPMVGDYISTSFSGSTATTLLAIGKPHTGSAFDEAMYAPATPLAVATTGQATLPATTSGVLVPVTGVGTGETHHAVRQE